MFTLGPRVYRAVETRPYERKASDPLERPLRVFTLDPSTSRFVGGEDTVGVPFEVLRDGPHVFEIDAEDTEAGLRYARLDFDDPLLLLTNGRKPAPHDPLFHQQMVYAVASLVYASFWRALGRVPTWGFAGPRLKLRPYGGRLRNAYYDKEQGCVALGYYQAEDRVTGRNLPGGTIFTCMSHDIIAHEITHALLDGMRARFTVPSCADVLAFHEAFADLIAIFQHFEHDNLLREALRRSKGDIRKESVLKGLGEQFGNTTGSGRALRSALTELREGEPLRYQDAPQDDPHRLGSVLVSAVFEAFLTVYRKKMAPYLRLATNGTGLLPEGDLSEGLLGIFAREAAKLAKQFLNICIRAIDYCPPVDLTFGEYLRAVVTADYDLVPDDPLGYREAWIDAFALHGIYPEGVSSLAEDALLWQPPIGGDYGIPELNLGRLEFDGDPARPSSREELERQARLLGTFVTRPEHLAAFSLVAPREDACDQVDPPAVESIRTLRRVGPDGQVEFDLVAEVTQLRTVRRERAIQLYGGATLILDARGRVRYAIGKRPNDARLERQHAFMTDVGRRFWQLSGAGYTPAGQLFQLLHDAQHDSQASVQKGDTLMNR